MFINVLSSVDFILQKLALDIHTNTKYRSQTTGSDAYHIIASGLLMDSTAARRRIIQEGLSMSELTVRAAIAEINSITAETRIQLLIGDISGHN